MHPRGDERTAQSRMHGVLAAGPVGVVARLLETCGIQVMPLGRASHLVGSRVSPLVGSGLVTVAAQLLQAVAGLLVVRALDKPEYAVYVIALNVAMAVSDVGDAGVLATMTRHGGKNPGDRELWSGIVALGVRFRRRTNAAALFFAVPVAFFLLQRAGASMATSVLLCTLIAALSFASAAGAMALAMLRLDLRYSSAGWIQVGSSGLRLASLATAVYLDLPTNAVLLMVLATVLPLWDNWLARRALALPRGGATPPELQHEYVTNAKRQFANSLFYLAQSQVLLVVLASTGNTIALAELTALSRFGQLFGISSTVLLAMATPVVARARTLRAAAVSYGLSVAAYLCAAGVLLGLLSWQSPVFLGLLGPGYSTMQTDFVIVSVGSLTAGLLTTVANLNQARAWLERSWFYIPTTTIWTAGLLVLVGASSLRHAAVFIALAPLAGIGAYGYAAWHGLWSERRRASTGTRAGLS